MNENTVGFVGIGMMGSPMASQLAARGHDVILFDMDRSRAEAVAREIGARTARTLEDLAGGAGVVITMLPNSDVVWDVAVEGADNLSKGMTAASTLIEMSSGNPSRTIALGEHLAGKSVRVIDAPVSGGVKRARTGELTIMTGGDKAVSDAVEPILSAMGSVTHVGALGAGQAMKALNNLVSAGGFLIGIEALVIGQRFGLEPELMVDILNSSTGMNNSTKNKFKQFVLNRQFDKGGFAIGLMSKDLGTAMDIARDSGTPAPFAAICSELWATASTMLGPDADHTAIARMCETFAATELASSKPDEDPGRGD